MPNWLTEALFKDNTKTATWCIRRGDAIRPESVPDVEGCKSLETAHGTLTGMALMRKRWNGRLAGGATQGLAAAG